MDIARLYIDGMSLRQTAKIFGCSVSKVRKQIIKSGVSIRSSIDGLILRNRNDIPIDNILDILQGELLGDSCIRKREHQSSFTFCNANYDYVKFIKDIFNNNRIPCNDSKCIYFHKNWKKWYTIYNVRTISTIQFHELEDKWYNNRIKIVPEDLKISPRLLLHWYMGDGTLPKGEFVLLCTDCFTKKECEFLSNSINSEIGIKSSVSNYRTSNRIFIPKTSVPLFLEYIGDPPFGSISYKWNLKPIGRVMHKVNIPYDILYNMYINDNMTSVRIAEHFKCSRHLISKKLNIYKIYKRTNVREFNFTYDELYDLYIKKDMTMSDIASSFNCSYQTIRSRLREFGIRKKKWRRYED